MFLCEQQGEEVWWKKFTSTENFGNFGCETLPTTVLTPIETDNAWWKIKFQAMCGSKHTSGTSQNSSSIRVELKHSLINRCATFSASRKTHCFYQCWQGLVLHAIIIHCRTKSARITNPDTLMVSHTWFWPKVYSKIKSRTQVSKHIPYHYILILFSILKKRWAFPNLHTLRMTYSHFHYIAELFPILIHCWGLTCLCTYPILILCPVRHTNMSDFQFKNFEFKKNTRRQILKLKFFDMSEFETISKWK